MSQISQSEKDQLILSNDSNVISSLGGGGGATLDNLNKSYEGLICTDFRLSQRLFKAALGQVVFV